MDEEALWNPTSETLANSQMTKFLTYVNEKQNKNFSHYSELYQWSIDEIGSFWATFAQFSDIIWKSPPLNPSLAIETCERCSSRRPDWFKGSTLNFAENILSKSPDTICITSYMEGFEKPVHLTCNELKSKVGRCSNWLRHEGIKPGDRVVAVMANTPETVVSMLACASVGAVWASCSPDFGASGIRDRLEQLSPSILLFTDSYNYNGKFYDCSETIHSAMSHVPTIRKFVKIPISKCSSENQSQPLREKEIHWNTILSEHSDKITFEYTNFDHPLFILFSSGTTGKPKCIIHGVGGTLLQHMKEHALHTDLGKEKSLFYFTTCGWMMWNWMTSALAVGSRIVLYEGSPSYPNLMTLWKIIVEEKIDVFGTSPKFISACMKAQIEIKCFKFPNLESILSTGSPLLPEHYDWVYQNIDQNIRVSSISGGTDIISCFMLGNPILPVYAGEIQCRGLGMAVESWNEDAKPVLNRKGELVCTKPFVSMPIGFWEDKDKSTYHQTYFNFFQEREVWRHGDFIEINGRGGVTVYGRSDATLNPGGVRIGTAEIYQQIEKFLEIQDSLVIGVKTGSDIEVWLFIKLAQGHSLSEDLKRSINNQIRSELTPRHLPNKIFQVNQIPYTKSGKKMEVPVTRILSGDSIDTSSSLAEPEALKEYIEMAKRPTK